jgi:hypothetical protein
MSCHWEGALSDERTGLSFVRVCQQYYVNCHYVHLFTFYMFYMITIYEYIQGLRQSGLSTAYFAIFLVASLLRQSRHLNGRMLDRRQVYASCIFCDALRLVQWCGHFHYHDCV